MLTMAWVAGLWVLSAWQAYRGARGDGGERSLAAALGCVDAPGLRLFAAFSVSVFCMTALLWNHWVMLLQWLVDALPEKGTVGNRMTAIAVVLLLYAGSVASAPWVGWRLGVRTSKKERPSETAEGEQKLRLVHPPRNGAGYHVDRENTGR